MKIKSMGLLVSVFIIVVFVLLSIQGCQQDTNPKIQTEYQSVVLSNGQYFFGKIEFLGKDYVRLKDVFYIYPQIDPKTKKVMSTLMKKGTELHGANQMYINTRYVMAIEPVSSESPVAKLMKEANAKKAEEPKK